MTESTSRLAIRHVTGFVYDGFAESSYNEARMTPLTSARQRVLEATLRTNPNATQLTYLDYFGSAVTAFDLHDRHAQLEVTAEALVEVVATEHEPPFLNLSDLNQSKVLDTYAEYLAATPRTALPERLHRELRSRVSSEDVDELIAAVSSLVSERVSYVPGSTHVTTTALESWNQKTGVCQDLSHLMIGFLRGHGVPARYVSGYLHPRSDAAIGETVVGQSHAWVEYYCGTWVGFDPTNGNDIGLSHVVVAKGRDYGDVPPLKGIYHGAPSRALGVSVEITRQS
ncbi:MAG: transglutaminase family protein [Acidimicrobiales bacterium]